MANSLKKRGQKFVRRFSKTSVNVGEESKEHIKENVFQRFSHIQNIRLLIFEWSLLVLALVLLSAAQAFWFSRSYAEDTFVSGGTYVEATVGRINSLNPLFATTSSEKTLSRLMFATLVTNDYSGHPGIGLAQSIRASEDGKVWTVKLRDNLQWSDGQPLTNEDVMFTMALIQNPAVNTIYDSNLENVVVRENERGEITFTLASAYADFASALEIPIVPKHELDDADYKTLVEDSFSVAPVTSGAFCFNATQTTNTVDDVIVYLSSNPYYYMNTSLLASFGVHTYQDKESVITALNSGAVTATAALSGSEATRVTASNFTRLDVPVNAGVFAFMNTSSGVMRDTSVRQAVREGLDMASVRSVAPDTEALDYPLLSSQIELSSYPALPASNPEAARTKLSELASSDGSTINIVTVNTGFLPAVATNIKEQLTQLGANATVTVYEETQEFIANIISRRAYDILVYEIELGADPDLLPYYHSSQTATSGLNLSNYHNSIVDDLLVGARETLSAELRAKKYESFLEYWVNEVPAIGLYRANLTYVVNKNVRAFNRDANYVTALDRFLDVTNWAVARGAKNLTP